MSPVKAVALPCLAEMAHLFICPNCGNRSAATDRTTGFTNQPKGCSKCGFGFLFELLDDYYPVATALEWGVRRLGKPVTVNAEGDLPAKAVADLFPAYDDDGGLLIVLTPSKG
jgi:predicted RNA-binding Zn-ribbon protein involved in translation (DUF1610 family)